MIKRTASDTDMMDKEFPYKMARKKLRDRNDVYRFYKMENSLWDYSVTFYFVLEEAYPNPDIDW